jgi:hypothetical protein
VNLDVLDAPPPMFEVIQLVRDRAYAAVCIADLPPGPPSRARHLARRLRTAHPTLKILIGRWGPDGLQDEEVNQTLHASTDHVGTTLHETATSLRALADAAPKAPRAQASA